MTPRRLSAEGFNSNSPRWSPDGKTLAVISTRSTESSATDPPKPQIYLLPMAVGGEAMPLTKLKNGVQPYQWSPEGSRIVLVSSSGPLDNVSPADRKSDVRHYSHIDYKFNDSGWFDDKLAISGSSTYPAATLSKSPTVRIGTIPIHRLASPAAAPTTARSLLTAFKTRNVPIGKRLRSTTKCRRSPLPTNSRLPSF